jgi:hypothetical protein
MPQINHLGRQVILLWNLKTQLVIYLIYNVWLQCWISDWICSMGVPNSSSSNYNSKDLLSLYDKKVRKLTFDKNVSIFSHK